MFSWSLPAGVPVVRDSVFPSGFCCVKMPDGQTRTHLPQRMQVAVSIAKVISMVVVCWPSIPGLALPGKFSRSAVRAFRFGPVPGLF